MRKKLLSLVLIGAIALLLGLSVPVAAGGVPIQPMAFWGHVTVDGDPAPGSTVTAHIDGLSWPTPVDGDSNYGYSPVFKIPHDDPETPAKDGGVDGDTIIFKVDGVPAEEPYTYKLGKGVPLDLHVGVAPEWYLHLSSTTGGSVTDPGEGTFGPYDPGDVESLVASPGGGYWFHEWTGDVGEVADIYDATTTVTMYGDYTIQADFEEIPPEWDLTLSSTTGGSVTVPGEGTFGPYYDGSVVSLVASPPDVGYWFTEWTGDVGEVDNVYAIATTVTMYGDYTIQANFELAPEYNLTLSSTTGGSVTVPGEGTFGPYYDGSVVSLVASPDAGYSFDEWTGDVGEVDDVHDATTTVTMYGDYTITANFQVTPPPPPPPVGGTAYIPTKPSILGLWIGLLALAVGLGIFGWRRRRARQRSIG